MQRREFITLLAGAATALPDAASAQQQAPAVVGVLHGGSASAFVEAIAAFEKNLASAGFRVGQNVVIEYRWADGNPQRLQELAVDLVRRQVLVIAAVGGNAPPLAARAVTGSIPIVFNTGADPVTSGLVASLNRPGGNVTGVSFLVEQVGEKGLGLLHELVPKAKTVGVLVNPQNSGAERQRTQVREAAATIGLQLELVNASTAADLEAAFAHLTVRNAGALLLAADPFFGTHITQIIALAAQHRLPTMYYRREFVAAGGLLSYGTSANEAYGMVGDYVARILKGAKPADLPVTQVVRFEFVINLKTARALGIEVPPGLSARADEIIE